MRFLILIIAIFFELSDVFAKPKIDAELVKLIEENKQTELKNYLKKKIPTDVKNTALQRAVEKNRVKIARMLIDNDANINVKDENGITPLMTATLRNYPKMVRMLIISNADSRIEDKNGDTALIHSIRTNNMECFSILSNTYPEIDKRIARGKALCIAMKLGRVEMAKLLIKRYADLEYNSYGKTALKFASARGYLDVVKLLIEKGVDVNARETCEFSALMEACCSGYIDIAKYLIEKGADVNVHEEMFGRTALMLANNRNRSEEDCIKLMKLLIDNGADTEVENKLTRTVLLQAAIQGRFAIVKFLIKNGAHVLFAKYRRLPNIFVMDRKTKQTVIGCLIKHAFTEFKDFVKNWR
jgi:ankyrin repeat protein